MRILSLILIACLINSPTEADTDDQRETLRDAIYILEEMLNSPDYDIPSDLLSKAKAIIIFPIPMEANLF